MNFRFIKGLGIIAVASMTLSFAACGSDDDDPQPVPNVKPTPGNGDNEDNGGNSGNGGNNQANGDITSINGTHLTGVGAYRFYYDTNGRVASVYNGSNPDITFDYGTGKLCFHDVEDGDDEVQMFNVRFTSEGYIASFSGSWDEVDDGYHYVGSGTCTFSYNADGHIVKAVYEGNDTETGPDGTYNDYGKSTVTFTWTADNLVKAFEQSYARDEDGEESWTNTNILTYGNTVNAFKQYSFGMGYLDFGEGTEILMCVGLFGKGPANLPNNLHRINEDNYTYDLTLRYDLNDTGTIATEYIDDYEIINYYYNTIDSRASFGSNKEAKKFSMRNFFKFKCHFRK